MPGQSVVELTSKLKEFEEKERIAAEKAEARRQKDREYYRTHAEREREAAKRRYERRVVKPKKDLDILIKNIDTLKSHILSLESTGDITERIANDLIKIIDTVGQGH